MAGGKGIVLRVVMKQAKSVEVMFQLVTRAPPAEHQLDAVEDDACHGEAGEKCDSHPPQPDDKQHISQRLAEHPRQSDDGYGSRQPVRALCKVCRMANAPKPTRRQTIMKKVRCAPVDRERQDPEREKHQSRPKQHWPCLPGVAAAVKPLPTNQQG